jgi:hypothetical protein
MTAFDVSAGKKGPARKREELRESLWPGSSGWIWDRRTNDGYISIPRILPLVMLLIRQLCQKEDPSPVYLDLWARNWDEGIVTISDEEDCAYNAGYTSKRAVRSWRERVWKLAELGFIKIQANGNREIGYILVLNPLMVCVKLRAAGKLLPDGWWPAFVRRTQEIGAVIPTSIPSFEPTLQGEHADLERPMVPAI